jgi:hypothetical protein
VSRAPLAEVRHLTGLDVVAVNRSHGLWFLTLADHRVVSLGAHPSASTIARALDAAGRPRGKWLNPRMAAALIGALRRAVADSTPPS